MKKGPKALKIEDAAKVFREIAKQIEANPGMMNVEGVFRISANAEKPPEIIKKILKSKDITKEGYTVHDLIGTLKAALKNNVLLQYENPHIVYLRHALSKVDGTKPETIDAAVKAIQQVIENLGKSSNIKDQCIAEIMHTYIHLANIAAQFSKTNKMTPDNLSIAAIGPLFYNNIMIAKDPMEALDLTSKAGPVAASAIESRDFQAAYEPPSALRAKPFIASEMTSIKLSVIPSSSATASSKENMEPEKPERRSDHRKR